MTFNSALAFVSAFVFVASLIAITYVGSTRLVKHTGLVTDEANPALISLLKKLGAPVPTDPSSDKTSPSK